MTTSDPVIKVGDQKISIMDYAIRGNGVLGIKESGKSYFTTFMGEQLLGAKIPFVALDPVGIWRWLRVPGKGQGYPVVVAGGEEPDIPLDPESAAPIVEAAMRDGVSVVLDMYSMTLSKADWRRIVTAAVRAMLYGNKKYGVRHVFIEEAAEFVPQVIDKSNGQVYAEVEKLVRMGGNASLGVTLINPRAEGLNKAVLELCDNLYLFRQVGRRSLENLEKWLKRLEPGLAKQIIADISNAPAGHGYAWCTGYNDGNPFKILPVSKTAFHPDRRAMRGDPGAAPAKRVDAGKFVQTMNASLEAIIAEAKANDPEELKRQIKDLERKLDKARLDASQAAPAEPDGVQLDAAYERGFGEGHHAGYRAGASYVQGKWSEEAERLQTQLAGEVGRMTTMARNVDLQPPGPGKAPVVHHPSALGRGLASLVAERRGVPDPEPLDGGTVHEGLTGPEQRIIDALAWLESAGIKPASRVQLGLMSRYAHTSGTFETYLGRIKKKNLIRYPTPKTVELLQDGRALANKPRRPLRTADLWDGLKQNLDGPLWKIVDTAIRVYPQAMTRQELGAATNYEPTSGTFETYLGRVKKLELIEYPEKGLVKASPLLFID